MATVAMLVGCLALVQVTCPFSASLRVGMDYGHNWIGVSMPHCPYMESTALVMMATLNLRVCVFCLNQLVISVHKPSSESFSLLRFVIHKKEKKLKMPSYSLCSSNMEVRKGYSFLNSNWKLFHLKKSHRTLNNNILGRLKPSSALH